MISAFRLAGGVAFVIIGLQCFGVGKNIPQWILGIAATVAGVALLIGI